MTSPSAGFFDDYPLFFETSKTSPFQNRLNRRWDAMIGANEDLIRGQRVLDIASHDGRWSFAALKAGATHVHGIEGRPELVESAGKNLAHYGFAPDRYRFVAGDIHREIARLEPGTFDTIFCLGFFYHTPHHAYLLQEIKRLNPKWLILDTVVSKVPTRTIAVYAEDVESERNAIDDGTRRPKALVGWPSRSAIEFMLETLGFDHEYFKWGKAAFADWTEIDDYKKGGRVTLRARNLDYK